MIYSTPGPVHVTVMVPVVWLTLGGNTISLSLTIHTKPTGAVYSACKIDCDPLYCITHWYM